MTISRKIFKIGEPLPPPAFEEFWWTQVGAGAGDESVDLERWSYVRGALGALSRDALLQSDTLDHLVTVIDSDPDQRNYARDPVAGVVHGTTDVYIMAGWDARGILSVPTGLPEPFLQVWRGASLLGPCFGETAANAPLLLIGPTLISGELYFGQVDQISETGRLLKTDLATLTSPPTSVGGPTPSGAFPFEPANPVAPSGCDAFVCTDEWAAMIVNNGGSDADDNSPVEAWVFDLSGTSGPFLVPCTGIAHDPTPFVFHRRLRQLPGVWLPGRQKGYYVDSQELKTYTISEDAVEFTSAGVSSELGATAWSILPNEQKLLSRGRLWDLDTGQSESFSFLPGQNNLVVPLEGAGE